MTEFEEEGKKCDWLAAIVDRSWLDVKNNGDLNLSRHDRVSFQLLEDVSIQEKVQGKKERRIFIQWWTNLNCFTKTTKN